MSANIYKTSSVQTLSPLKNLISSKQSIYSTAIIEHRLQDIDNRITTWKKIASKEHIDITDEDNALSCIIPGFSKEADKSVRVFNLLLIEGCKGRICNRIVKKVKSNLRREPEADKLQSLNKELFDLTNKKVIPWIRKAREEGVDIKEEMEAMNAANKSSLDKLKEKSSNPQHVLEVVQRRLKKLRIRCCMRILTKTYIKRIRDFAEKTKSKDWFNDKRIWVIEGISSDAIVALLQPCKLKDMEEQCKEVYELFKNNIILFEEDPTKYHELANREWLQRKIIYYSEKFFELCKAKKNLHLAKEIFSVRKICMQLLQSDIKTAEIRERVNKTFDLFAERISGVSKFGGCGFMVSDGQSYNKDNDPTA